MISKRPEISSPLPLNGRPIALPFVSAMAEVYANPGRMLRIAGAEVPTFREAAARVRRLSELARAGLAVQITDVLEQSGGHYFVTDLDASLLEEIG